VILASANRESPNHPIRTTKHRTMGRVPMSQTSPAPVQHIRSWKAPAFVFLLTFVAYAATIGRELSGDVWTAHLAACQITETGHGWIDVTGFPALDEHPLRSVWVVETQDGHEAIGRAPGTIAAALPAYWLSGQTTMTVIPGGLTAAAITALAVVLLHLSLRDRLGNRDALLAAALFGLTTPVWTVSANGMWPHTLTVLGIVGMAWAADKNQWWLVGLFGGVALWGRLHAVLICALLGLLLAIARGKPMIAVKAGISSGGMLVMMSAWTHWMYGTWNPTAAYRTGDFTHYAETHRIDLVNHLGFWVSPDRGILIWTPLVALLLPATVRNWKNLPDWSRYLVLGGIVYTLVQGSLNRFSGGDNFYGYRLGLEIVACLTPALALSARTMGVWSRRLFTPVAALQFAMILPGALLDSFDLNADEVWVNNAFYEVLKTNPRIFPLLMLLIFAWAWLVARIWASPGLEKSARPRLSGAGREPTGRNLP
jgi:hypothetical protein